MISIIIPTLNEETALENTIKSVFPAEIEHEFIIVDAESTDNTGSIAGRYGKVLSIKKHSRGASMDLGAQHASGDILLFLHSDTQLPAGALEKINKHMENPKIIWGGFKRCLSARGWKYRLLDMWVLFCNRFLKIIAGDQGIFCRKDIFLNIGRFMDMPIFEDVSLSARLRRLGEMGLIKDCIHVSIRRYEKRGILKISALNLLLTLFYICGVSPERIYQIYYSKFRKRL
jgi:hypothetical protein